MGLIEHSFDGISMVPLNTNESNRFKPRMRAGTNVNRAYYWTDYATAYRGHRRFIVPTDVDAGGTVTFLVAGVPTPVAATVAAWRFAHSPIAHGEDHDIAYSSVDSGDVSVSVTADDLVLFEWTETIANLGWVAHDLVYFYVERIAPVGVEPTTPSTLDAFRISIPTA